LCKGVLYVRAFLCWPTHAPPPPPPRKTPPLTSLPSFHGATGVSVMREVADLKASTTVYTLEGLGHERNIFLKAYIIESVQSPLVFKFIGCVVEERINIKVWLASVENP
jgi:hypothetical protein